MGVYIKGMKMPENCFRCVLRTFGTCPLSVEITDAICNDTRPNDCPLVEIPPHGDLIDRSQISGLLDKDRHNRNIYQLVWNDAINTVIQTMPTIIPAEESEA